MRLFVEGELTNSRSRDGPSHSVIQPKRTLGLRSFSATRVAPISANLLVLVAQHARHACMRSLRSERGAPPCCGQDESVSAPLAPPACPLARQRCGRKGRDSDGDGSKMRQRQRRTAIDSGDDGCAGRESRWPSWRSPPRTIRARGPPCFIGRCSLRRGLRAHGALRHTQAPQRRAPGRLVLRCIPRKSGARRLPEISRWTRTPLHLTLAQRAPQLLPPIARPRSTSRTQRAAPGPAQAAGQDIPRSDIATRSLVSERCSLHCAIAEREQQMQDVEADAESRPHRDASVAVRRSGGTGPACAA